MGTGFARKYREILGLHCFLKEDSPTGVFAVDCSGVNGFVGHKDGSVVRICAGKSLDEDRMTVLEPGRFGIGGQPTI